MRNNILAHVVELRHVKQASAHAHLLEIERELPAVLRGIRSAPVFKVRVEQRHDIFDNALLGISLLNEVADRRLGVFSLRELALGARLLVYLHDLRSVRVFRHSVAARLEQRDVLRDGGYPLLAANNVRRAHEVVVADMCKVIGRHAVALQKHLIDYILRHFNFAADHVVKDNSLVLVALGAEAEHIGLASLDASLLLVKAQVAALRPFAEISGYRRAAVFLLFADSGELVRSAEAGVCLALLHKTLGDRMVNFNALALGIRTVSALLCVESGHALIKFETEIFESVDYCGHAVGDLTLLVRVLDSQISQSAADSRRKKIDERAEQAAYMEIPRRTR